MVQAPVKPLNRQLTDKEFRQFLRDDCSDNFYELVDGWLQVMTEPGGKHQFVVTRLIIWLENYIAQQNLPLQTYPMTLCKLGKGDWKRPDLIVVDKEIWERNTKREAILEDPPELAIEIVSTNWEDDYIKKPLRYAAFGIKEYWIVDLLLKLDQYPKRKHPEINEPTLSIGTLKEGAYRWQRFTGDRQIESSLFPGLELTVEKILQAIS